MKITIKDEIKCLDVNLTNSPNLNHTNICLYGNQRGEYAR